MRVFDDPEMRDELIKAVEEWEKSHPNEWREISPDDPIDIDDSAEYRICPCCDGVTSSEKCQKCNIETRYESCSFCPICPEGIVIPDRCMMNHLLKAH